MLQREDVYEDNTIDIDMFVFDESKVFIGVELLAPFSVSMSKHWLEVLMDIEDGLKQRGVDRLYVLVADQKGFDFAKHMGFQSAYVSWGDQHELMEKAL